MSEKLMCHIHGCYDLRLSRVMQEICLPIGIGKEKISLLSGISSITARRPFYSPFLNKVWMPGYPNTVETNDDNTRYVKYIL